MKKQLLFAFGAAALLASCSNEIDSPSQNLGDGYLHVNATIDEVKTRVTGNTWDNNDQIGVSGAGSENVLYTYNGSGFTSTDGIKVSEAGGKFTAYYPYASSVTGNSISFNVVGSSDNAPVDQKTVDFLFASETATVSNSQATVEFSFKHMMSQLTLTVVDKTYDTSLSGKSVSVKLGKLATSGSFSTETGEVTPGDKTGTMQLSSVTVGTATTVIVPSYATANEDAIEVTLTIDDVNYTGSIKPILAAGNQYSYDLNISSTEPTEPTPGETNYTLEITGSNITPWTNNSGDGYGSDMNKEVSIGDFLLNNGETVKATTENVTKYGQYVVGVVYYAGNPHASVIHSGTIDGTNDVLKKDFPDISRGLAIAVDNAGSEAVTMRSQGNDYNAWFTSADNTSYVSDLYKGSLNDSKNIPSLMIGYNYTILMKRAETESSSTGYIETATKFITTLDSYNESNQVTNASTWYLPSYAEFEQILTNYSIISASFNLLEGKSLAQYDSYELTSSKKSILPKAENYYWTSDIRNASNQWVHELNGTQTKPSDDEATSLDITMYLNPGTKGFFRFAIAF